MRPATRLWLGFLALSLLALAAAGPWWVQDNAVYSLVVDASALAAFYAALMFLLRRLGRVRREGCPKPQRPARLSNRTQGLIGGAAGAASLLAPAVPGVGRVILVLPLAVMFAAVSGMMAVVALNLDETWFADSRDTSP